MTLPAIIRFKRNSNSQYAGRTLVRGTGPAREENIGGGVFVILNASNRWYGISASMDAEYLLKHMDQWETVEEE